MHMGQYWSSFGCVFSMCVCVPICEEIHGLTSEVFHFFQRHSRMSYMASNFVYLEVIATYIRQHPKLDSCGQIPVFHQLNEGMQTLPIFFSGAVCSTGNKMRRGRESGYRTLSFSTGTKLLPNMQAELHDSNYLVPKSHPFSSVEWFNWKTAPLGLFQGGPNVCLGHTKEHLSRVLKLQGLSSGRALGASFWQPVEMPRSQS